MQYDNSFKQEPLKLSYEIGVRKAAELLDIPSLMILYSMTTMEFPVCRWLLR